MRVLHPDRSSDPAVKISAGRRAFQRAVDEKGPDGLLTCWPLVGAFPARPHRRFTALFQGFVISISSTR